MAISFSISAWSGWVPTTSSYAGFDDCLTVSDSPDVSLIPAMLRRRLNLLGRACASEIMKHSQAGQNMPVVYCSQHGDIERTVSVLQELVSSEPVSPMHFSLAVHNAVAGVMSIQNNNTANISAIAASQQGVIPTLLEAAGILSTDCPQVLCVICDVPLPDIYQQHDNQPETAYAVSFVLSLHDGTGFELEINPDTGTPTESTVSQGAALDFLCFLASGKPGHSFVHNHCQWTIRKTGETTQC